MTLPLRASGQSLAPHGQLCPDCGGAKIILDVRLAAMGMAGEVATCPRCQGYGQISQCPLCGGHGCYDCNEGEVAGP